MVYLVYDGGGLLFCVTESWPMARSAMDCLVAKNEDDPPRLEIYSGSAFGLDLLDGVDTR